MPLSRSLARQESIPAAEKPRSPEGVYQIEVDRVGTGAKVSVPDFWERI